MGFTTSKWYSGVTAQVNDLGLKYSAAAERILFKCLRCRLSYMFNPFLGLLLEVQSYIPGVAVPVFRCWGVCYFAV